MRNKCPHRPPRPPRCLCRTTSDWLLGIVSPSLLFKLLTGAVKDPAAVRYDRNIRAYKLKVIRWKISQRTCGRGAWRLYRNHKWYLRKRRQRHERQ